MLSLLLLVLAAAPSPQLTWSVRSPNGTAQLTQTGVDADACELECTIAGKPSWKVQRCMGRGSDFTFVSNDCGAALTLFEYPLKQATPAGTPVAVSLVGGTSRTFFLGQLGAPWHGEGKRLRWLGGVVGEPGVKPHLDATETGVEFMTVDGQLRTVRLTNPEDLLPQRATARAGQQQATGGMYQFTAADGSTQFVMGLDQVPKKLRKSARPVESEIAVMGAAPRSASPLPSAPSATTTSKPWPSAARPAPSATNTEPGAFKNSCGIYGLPESGCIGVMRQSGLLPQGGGGALPPAPPPTPPPSGYEPRPSPYK